MKHYFYTRFYTEKEPNKPHYWRHINDTIGRCFEDCKKCPDIIRAEILNQEGKVVLYYTKGE